jgi:hypothetical protein
MMIYHPDHILLSLLVTCSIEVQVESHPMEIDILPSNL